MTSKQPWWIYPVGAIAFTLALVIAAVAWFFPNFSREQYAAEFLESHGCEVQVIDPLDQHFQGEVTIQIDGTTLQPNEAHWCGTFAKVTQLTIANCEAPEKYLAEIANPGHVSGISFERCQVTREVIAELHCFTKLRHLSIADSPLTIFESQGFKELPTVKELCLSGPQVTDGVISHVGAITELWDLQLKRTSVTEEGLAGLVPLKQLSFLTIEGSTLSATGLQHIGRIRVAHLKLCDTKVTTEGVAELVKMDLSTIGVSSTCVSSDDILKLKLAFPPPRDWGDAPGLFFCP